MNTATLRHGDTVEVNVRGRVFNAVVVSIDTTKQEVTIIPPKWCTYHHVSAREVRKRLARFDPRKTQLTSC